MYYIYIYTYFPFQLPYHPAGWRWRWAHSTEGLFLVPRVTVFTGKMFSHLLHPVQKEQFRYMQG